MGGQLGEGERLTSDAPRNRGRHPPHGDALSPPPQGATPAHKGARCRAGAGFPCPHRPHPVHTGRGTPAARPRGRAAGGGTAPDTGRPSQRWQASPPGTAPRHPRGTQPPQGMQAKGAVMGPDTRTPAPTARVEDGPRQLAQRADSRGRGSAWQQTPLTMDTRAAKTGLPAPEEHREYGPRRQRWTPYPHTLADSTWAAGPDSPQEEGSWRGESARPRTPLATGPPQTAGGGAPSADTHTRMPTRGTVVRAHPPTPRRAHSTCTSDGKSAPHPLLLGTATQQ